MRIFEPQPLLQHESTHKLDYRWCEVSKITVHDGYVSHLSWNLDGYRLLIATGNRLMLYQHNLLQQFLHGMTFKMIFICFSPGHARSPMPPHAEHVEESAPKIAFSLGDHEPATESGTKQRKTMKLKKLFRYRRSKRA